jgi:hypothetical protein
MAACDRLMAFTRAKDVHHPAKFFEREAVLSILHDNRPRHDDAERLAVRFAANCGI